jgi:4-hydroxybenzoate polyprenyltransferase
MIRGLKGIIQLSRFKEFTSFVIVTTLLGTLSGKGVFGWPLAIVLVANWLVVAFAFMINDIEDAADDAINPAKVNRNPISAGLLSIRTAWLVTCAVGLASIFFYAQLGLYPFIAGTASLAISFLYSWRQIRLKTVPGLDVLSHGLMLAGLQFLAAYYCFNPGELSRWLYPFLFIVAISMYGVLFNQLRDLEWDRQAGLTHTAAVLGPGISFRLMMSFGLIGVGAAAVTVFVIQLIPTWVLAGVGFGTLVLLLPALNRMQSHSTPIEFQQSFQKPLEIATATALSAQFVFPVLSQLLKLYRIF